MSCNADNHCQLGTKTGTENYTMFLSGENSMGLVILMRETHSKGKSEKITKTVHDI